MSIWQSLPRREGSFVRQQMGVHYPQARVNEVSAEDDPLRLREGEQAWSMDLRLRGPEYLPLRTFRDDDLLDRGSDPLISVIGPLSDLEEGERVVSRAAHPSTMAARLAPYLRYYSSNQPLDDHGHRPPGAGGLRRCLG